MLGSESCTLLLIEIKHDDCNRKFFFALRAKLRASRSSMAGLAGAFAASLELEKKPIRVLCLHGAALNNTL